MAAMAPVAYTHHKRGIFRNIAPILVTLDPLLFSFGQHEFGKSTHDTSFFKSFFCSKHSWLRSICTAILYSINGFNAGYLDETYLPVLLAHTPSGSSTHTVAHYAQQIFARKFQAYDYGPERNQLEYGTKHPTEFSLSKVKVPVGLFWADNDFIAGPQDILIGATEFPNLKVNHRVTIADFNHMDFLWAENAREFVYERLIQFLNQY